jgi:glycosyltransferase involved in cell wall biosynthesis
VKKIYCTVTNDLSYDQRMQRICGSLVNAGYKVTLVGRKLKHSKPLSDFNFKQKRLKCIFNKGKMFYLEYNIRLFFFFLFLRKYDAICAVDLDTLLATSLASSIRRKKLIYDAHEYFTELPELVGRPSVKKIWAGIGRFCIPKCDLAYTVCSSLATEFAKKYHIEFGVIRNLPVSQHVRQHFPINMSEPYIILYQGMLNDGRGLEEMLEAMQHFEADNVQLWIAGEGDLSEALRNKATVMNLGEKVKFLGFVSPDELKSITQKADIGINLLQNKGLNYYYSLANKFFDYVMAEKPSICMDFPEYRLHCQEFETAVLIPDLNKDSIINAIESLCQNDAQHQKIRENCQKAKLVWNWENEEKKLITMYHNLFS